MNFPSFLDIEGSSYDEGSFPASIAWSLSDGRIKSVLIMPEDDWNPRGSDTRCIDIDLLYDQGASGLDVIRELNDDLEGQTIYIDGVDADIEWIDLLYETFDMEPTFEISRIDSLFPDVHYHELLELRNNILMEKSINPDEAEGCVLALLYLYQDCSHQA